MNAPARPKTTQATAIHPDAPPPNRVPWPPLIYVVAALVAIALHVLWPLPWFGEPLSDILFALGCIVAGAGALLDLAALNALRRARTTIMPHRASERLVTDGPFALTRNPIYLGNTMLLVGIGLAAGILWFLVTAPIAAFATTKLAIEREERHLEGRFPKAFRDYRGRVRRWL